ncbi:hypothetical protein GF339_16415 [candidate division KSB3 bacterium]|uniref:Uncharacterized protein n=1 Tax=candidate division KSB3 bacterium TaxID=2044937 RepID=A0A9D5Q7D0_9BACT|nr:hypothetical protein [candidate division KSB3 bacterium]MBD3326172.1 hypothetical protein [candidate division KSB3 bacterium]
MAERLLLSQIIQNPYYLRSKAKGWIRKYHLGSYKQRLNIGAIERPHYGYCLYNASVLAKKLGYDRISVIEFGVAGGEGLLQLERHAHHIEKLLSLGINIYGFDIGEGLPEPVDYRDLPYHWKKGFYKMDVPTLQDKLKVAKLILGDVKETVETFFEKYAPPPIGAVMFDLDFYSSTTNALKIFEAPDTYFLPRIYCYFDDVVGSKEIELYNDYIGVRLAIHEFNQNHIEKKLGIAYHLLARQIVEKWYHKIWIYHDFSHRRYNVFISKETQELPL